ncbi:unnamed protein product, partial [Mesorhabditis belari]|uniref:Uncharacterized protein n=1 Tax=Mesorhabditis belari TaxID=2138241 RepID=A0AAF3JC56_9BILA
MNLRIAAQSDHSFGANRCHKKRKKKNKVDAGPSEDHGELEAKRAKMNERVTGQLGSSLSRSFNRSHGMPDQDAR